MERAGGIDVLAVQRVEKQRRRTAVLGVNRRSNLTPYRRPILTPLSGGFWR